MSNLLDTFAVATLLNIKPSTVRWYHKRGVIPPADKKFGRSLVWELSTIEDWKKTRKSTVSSHKETENVNA